MSGGLSTGADLMVRPYRDVDEPEVIELLRGSLGEGPGGRRSPEYFRWKHLENHFGRSYMIVAESGGRIVGFRALMRWRFRTDDRMIEAVRPVDTVTHPEERGRGVFSTLTRAALDALKGEIDLVFNTPNSNSLPGYLKMGWQVAGQIPVRVHVVHPARFLSGKLARRRSDAAPSRRPDVSAPAAAEILADGPRIAALLERSEVPGPGYATPRSVEYLRWRYGRAPLLDYHGVLLEEAGEPVGLALFRLRAEGSLWGISVSDMFVRHGDVTTARRLLAEARRSTKIAYLAAALPPGSTAERAHRGPTTVRAPHGMTFVVNPIRPHLDPDPRLLASWALATGDVEVF